MAEAVTQGATSPGEPAKPAGRFGASLRKMLVPVLAVFTALVVGGIVIKVSGGNPFLAYQGLWEGAFGSPKAISETLIWATPYIFAGLAVALGFGGLFDIGAEGQLALGAVAAGAGRLCLTQTVEHQHPFNYPCAAGRGCGCVGGLWGAIPGWLKARTGSHKVMNTIVMNYIALLITSFLLNGPMKNYQTR